jgi:hypothetical protein
MSPLSIDETRSLRVSWLTDYTLLAGCYIGVTRSQHGELTIQGEAYIFHRDDSSGRSRNCPVPGDLSRRHRVSDLDSRRRLCLLLVVMVDLR